MNCKEQVVFLKAAIRFLLSRGSGAVVVTEGQYGSDYEVILSLIEQGFLGRYGKAEGDPFYLNITPKGIEEFERMCGVK